MKDLKAIRIDEVMAFDMYFASVASANVAERKLSIEGCAAMAIDMLITRRSLIPPSGEAHE